MQNEWISGSQFEAGCQNLPMTANSLTTSFSQFRIHLQNKKLPSQSQLPMAHSEFEEQISASVEKTKTARRKELQRIYDRRRCLLPERLRWHWVLDPGLSCSVLCKVDSQRFTFWLFVPCPCGSDEWWFTVDIVSVACLFIIFQFIMTHDIILFILLFSYKMIMMKMMMATMIMLMMKSQGLGLIHSLEGGTKEKLFSSLQKLVFCAFIKVKRLSL